MSTYLRNGNGNGHPSSDSLPPQNLEAERSVLGGLLIDPSQIEAVLDLLSPGDFYRDAHQVLFSVMTDLWLECKPLDAVVLADELVRRSQYDAVGGDDLLFSLTESVPHGANLLWHARIVREKSVARQLIQDATELIRDGYSNLYTSGQLHESARARLESIAAPSLEPWSELSFEHEPAAPPFPTWVFPEALERFCRGTAAVTLAPHDVVGVSMLAAASAAIGQSVNLHLKRTWHEAPLLYLLIVADPGRSKTPPMKLVVRPLTNLDGELRASSRADRALWEEMKKLAKGQPVTEPEPPQRRAVVKDVTRETLVAILADNPRGLLADPDEATGWVGSFDQYRSKGTDRQFWLDLWSSRSISVDREGGRRSSWVGSPFVTVVGGLPPDMLSSLGEEHGRNDGFLDRLLFTFPAEFPEQHWTEAELDAADENLWHTVLRKLHAAPMYYDADRNLTRPYVVDFQPEAKALWIEWYNAHCAEMEDPDSPVWTQGVWSKLRAYCARFALILSRLRLATDPDLQAGDCKSPVSEHDVRGAIALVDYFKGHSTRVQHRLTGGTGDRDALAILSWIRRKRVTEFREAECRKDLARRFHAPQSLEAPLHALVAAGAIRQRNPVHPSMRRGRKPTRTFEVNPQVLTPPEKTLGSAAK